MKSFSLWFVVWIVTTQSVNLALYLAVTRVAHGWRKSISAYLAGYLVPLAVCMILINPQLHGGVQGEMGALPFGFIAFFVIWGALVMMMTRGTWGFRLFSTLVCGIHQIGAISFSLILLHRVKPEPVGALFGCLVMAVLGAFLVLKVLPRVRAMGNDAGWRDLNLTAVMNFVLLYVTGIWPTYVPAGTAEDIICFLIANVVAVVYFPVALAFSERQRTASALAIVERSMKLMANEVAARHMAIDAARRQRHDSRHHRIAIAEYLLRGQVDKALRYLEQLDAEAGETPTDKLIWCENDTINAILSGSARKAAALGIGFEVTANVERTVNLPDIDVVAVVANLIENAINAVGSEERGERIEDRGQRIADSGERIEDRGQRIADRGERIEERGERIEDRGQRIADRGERREDRGERIEDRGERIEESGERRVESGWRKVTVALRQRERTFGMTVTNPVSAGFVLSSKGLPCEELGVGLESVQRVVDRHNGDLVYAVVDGVLECQVLVKTGISQA